MGLFDKFKAPVAAAAVPDDLDFMGAIEAHIRWKVRLEAYVSGDGAEKLDPAVVGKDDLCALGKWIYGPGGVNYGALPLFQSLKETHAGFHQCAAQVIQSADEGDTVKASEILSRGCYAKHSNKVKAELARLSIELDNSEE
ncbi:MAG: CZB domain-containing protein [Pseudomonadota bacterium]|nr:CZB domain-containing protein [Gammaproteobacteria bacterium]MBU1731083.1 CZB domain-containing protein [Gammaproteobacteria bacterium]MBU1894147.1 CZB domain-containing protein [Gammaproteobacteria bacterium]